MGFGSSGSEIFLSVLSSFAVSGIIFVAGDEDDAELELVGAVDIVAVEDIARIYILNHGDQIYALLSLAYPENLQTYILVELGYSLTNVNIHLGNNTAVYMVSR